MVVDVTALGDVNLDILFLDKVDFENNENEQIFLSNILVKVGGGAANFSVWASRLGFKIRLIGCLGSDFVSDFILEELRKSKVDVKIVREKVKTGVTLAFQFSNERKFLLTWKGNNSIFSLKHISFNDFEGEVLYLSGYNLLDSLRKDFITIIQKAKDKDMIVCLDPDIKARLSFDKEEFFKIVNLVDVLFLNEDECKKISSNFGWFKSRTLVVKRGSRGAFAIENGEKAEVEGIKLDGNYNTTGAGDVFNASFLHHYYYGYDLKECLEFANEQAVEYIKEINNLKQI